MDKAVNLGNIKVILYSKVHKYDLVIMKLQKSVLHLINSLACMTLILCQKKELQ